MPPTDSLVEVRVELLLEALVTQQVEKMECMGICDEASVLRSLPVLQISQVALRKQMHMRESGNSQSTDRTTRGGMEFSVNVGGT